MISLIHSLVACLVVLSIITPIECTNEAEQGFLRGTTIATNNTSASSLLVTTTVVVVEDRINIEETEHTFVTSLAERMKPRTINIGDIDPNTGTVNIAPPTQQFFHLHHMKSGGTSLSSWISCGQSRLDIKVSSSGLSECSGGSYRHCIQNENDGCRKRIDAAVMMNYCSPLAVAKYFNWTNADAVTMMRHPVDRVWSMFRFQTHSCFKCTNLTQVYADMDAGNTTQYGGGICLQQLSNHITRNLQKNINVNELDTITLSDEVRVADAIDSIQNSFTVVGVIERLEETVELMSYSFPWLSEKIETEGNGDGDKYGSKRQCPFPHSNGSPTNNRCGDNGGHWNLPSEPDEETRKAIEEHNLLDIKVYEAALQHFELQKEAMALNDSEDIE